MIRLGYHEGSLALIKPVRSPSIIVLGRDTALGEDAGLSLSLDHDTKVQHQPCLLEVTMMGENNMGTSPLPSRGPMVGRNQPRKEWMWRK